MASNFRILVHRNSDSLHLKLVGDFDGSSAHELINALKEDSAQVRKIFVHTNSLKHVHMSGREVFQDSLPNIGNRLEIINFTGEYVSRIAPEFPIADFGMNRLGI